MIDGEIQYDEDGYKYVQAEQPIGACSARYHQFCTGYLRDIKRVGIKCGCDCHKERTENDN